MNKVAILSTGNELIYGHVQDSNAFFISQKLFPTDFNVHLSLTVGDNPQELQYAIQQGLERADIVIITGGLGPTDDDLTVDTLQTLFGFKKVIHEEGRNRVELFFTSMNRTVLQEDLKMVTVPDTAHVFVNDVGLASGFAIHENQKTIIAMPGVPREMQYMFEKKVLPHLMNKYQMHKKEHVQFRTVLMREAEVNHLVNQMQIPWEDVTWGITTEYGMNILTFVQKGMTAFPANLIRREAEKLFGDKVLLPDSVNIETELVHLLKNRKLSLAVAESCTGGYIAKRITDVSGSSEVFKGGVVAYSNQAKQNVLSVSPISLEKYGAVSEQVAKEMTIGVKSLFESDIGISTTGIAGPSGGTREKPVGMICFGVAWPDTCQTMTRHLKGDRERIRFYSAQFALNTLRQYLLRI